MSNSKFNLIVLIMETATYVDLKARVFDFESLSAVDRAIRSDVFGHYSKKRYVLAPCRKAGDMAFAPSDLAGKFYRLYPNGGRTINPEILELLKSSEPLTFTR